MKSRPRPFTAGELEGVCRAIAHTTSGLTGAEIGHALRQLRVVDVDPGATKWQRLYSALANRQNSEGSGSIVLSFIHNALEPSRYSGKGESFEERRAAVNVPLAFVGLQYGSDGRFHTRPPAVTLAEAEQRASRLKSALQQRNVDPEVLRYCRAELLQENYFHAVLEASKSVAAKLRSISGLTTDGAELVQGALGGANPLIQINALSTETERGEQRGFLSLLVGLFGTFRNPVAHEPRIEWPLDEADALDLFCLTSYAHRRLRRALRRP